jgi:uncharacterized protein (TIGR01777 family)
MRVAITGSTGFVGTALTEHLRSNGHDVVPVVRGDSSDPEALWNPEQDWVRDGALEGVDALVHLAGASIGEGRWSDSRKRLLRSSRIEATRLLVDHLATLESRPRVVIGASAVGYYGDREDEELTEDAAAGEDFLAEIARDWERETLRAAEQGARAVVLRTGIVLAGHGGALPRMLLPFKLGAGGRLGSGRQWMSWISLGDAVRVIAFALEQDELSGPVNAVAPGAVTNREFTKVLGRVLRRPTFMPAPGFALRLLLGEQAKALLLSGQHVVPRRLSDAGFEFTHEELEPALREALGK